MSASTDAAYANFKDNEAFKNWLDYLRSKGFAIAEFLDDSISYQGPSNYFWLSTTKQKLFSVWAQSGDPDDQEYEKLRAFFWDHLPTQDKPGTVADPQGCHHEWHEVILFHTPGLRCRFCDIKKPSGQ